MKKRKTKQLVLIASLAAVSAVLMVFRFPIPFMPPFLSFDLAGVPELIGAFCLGPLAGVMIIIVRILVQLVISGTNSMFTGELQSFLLSVALVLPASWLYTKNKTKNGAIKAMLVAIVVNVVMAVFTNMVIIIPFYVTLYGMSMNDIIAMTQAVNPYVDSAFKLVILGIVPFNLLKSGVVCLVTLMVYKKLSLVIHRYSEM